MSVVRRIESKVDAVEGRLAWVYPTNAETREQIEESIDRALAPGTGIRVFADDE
jgi:hypothetical protein